MEDVPFKSKFVASPKGDLHILEQSGDEKNPLFFIHGNSLCASAYRPFLEALYEKSGKKIVAADIRGHGLSTKNAALPLKNWNIFVEDAVHLAKNTLKTPVTGVGHSMGGVFFCMAAARFPELFSRLILLDPVIFLPWQIRLSACTQALGLKNWFSLPRQTRKKRNRFPDRKSAADHYRGKGMFRDWTEECLEGFIRDGLKSADEGLELSCTPELEARFYESIPAETWSCIKKIQCPVDVVRAENSRFFTPKAAGLLQKNLASSRLFTFQKGKHFFPLDSPEKSAELVVNCCTG